MNTGNNIEKIISKYREIISNNNAEIAQLTFDLSKKNPPVIKKILITFTITVLLSIALISFSQEETDFILIGESKIPKFQLVAPAFLFLLVSLIYLAYLYLDYRSIVINEESGIVSLRNTNKQYANEIKHLLSLEYSKNNQEIQATSSIIDNKFDLNALVINFSDCKSRLNSELKQLETRVRFNLSIGAGTSAIGILFLLYTFLFNDQPIQVQSSIPNYIHYYLSRISIVLFIEIFSLFFLRLYRNSLSDIKYYQNELTNIDFKFIALKTALIKDSPDNISLSIQEFLKIDRNQIINADQTTIIDSLKKYDLDNDRTFPESFNSVLESASKFLKNKE